MQTFHPVAASHASPMLIIVNQRRHPKNAIISKNHPKTDKISPTTPAKTLTRSQSTAKNSKMTDNSPHHAPHPPQKIIITPKNIRIFVSHKHKHQSHMTKPRILIIYTGGTIGMIENPDTKSLQPFDFSHLIDNVPKIRKLNFEIDNIQFDTPLDSSNITPKHWGTIANAISSNYSDYDGFVVLHGTDTMAYTASALSFMLENLRKPVIITGSQLPIGEVRTDGEENLITALQIAAAKGPDGQPTVQEVAILFEDYLWRGNRSTKMSADHFNAFKSNNYPYLAKIGLEVQFREEALWRQKSQRPLKVQTRMDNNVMVIQMFPGITETTLRYILSTPDIKGIVLKTYGAGNAPTDSWFIRLMRDVVERGVVVINVSQCINGGVHSERYMTGNTLQAAGVVSGYDITAEAAITKLMYLFGMGLSADEVKKYLNCSLCGEVTV